MAQKPLWTHLKWPTVSKNLLNKRNTTFKNTHRSKCAITQLISMANWMSGAPSSSTSKRSLRERTLRRRLPFALVKVSTTGNWKRQLMSIKKSKKWSWLKRNKRKKCCCRVLRPEMPETEVFWKLNWHRRGSMEAKQNSKLKSVSVSDKQRKWVTYSKSKLYWQETSKQLQIWQH